MHHSLNRLSSDIDMFYAKTRPTSELIEEKEKLFSFISECVSYLHAQFQSEIEDGAYSPHAERGFFLDNMATKTSSSSWRTFKFGSEAWATSCCDSDVDIAVALNFRNNRFDKKFILKTLSRAISDNDADEQLRVQLLLGARYPIIRVYHRHTQFVKLDISIADRFCERRTELISSLLRHYEQVLTLPLKRLIIFIKTWAKARRINSAYHGFLNSFGFTLLILKFVESLVDEHRHILRFRKSVSVLVLEFFEFYVLRFNLAEYCVRLESARGRFGRGRERRRGFEAQYPRKRRRSAMMEVMDPVNDDNNVAQSVGYAQYHGIAFEFIRAFKILRAAQTQTDGATQLEGAQMAVFDALLVADWQPHAHENENENDNASEHEHETASVGTSVSASEGNKSTTACSTTDTELESEGGHAVTVEGEDVDVVASL